MKRVECVDAISTVTNGLKEEDIIYASNILRGLWKYSKTRDIKELYSIQSCVDKLIIQKGVCSDRI
jgi:hypothetical protein